MGNGYTHFNKVSGINAIAVGEKDSEIDIADSEGNLSIKGTALTATAAEINAAADLSAQETMSPGAGWTDTAGSVYESSNIQQGAIFTTSILIDITSGTLLSGDTMIIGKTSGVAHIGQVLALTAGTIIGGTITCLETPAGAADNIDLYSATEGDALAGVIITDSTETALLERGAAWAIGDVKAFAALPPANSYLYLAAGEDDDGDYSAGKFLIQMYGI